MAHPADCQSRRRKEIRARAGYDTKRLFIGSHNAFGKISTAIFKIIIAT
jgi:hypothetical protein